MSDKSYECGYEDAFRDDNSIKKREWGRGINSLFNETLRVIKSGVVWIQCRKNEAPIYNQRTDTTANISNAVGNYRKQRENVISSKVIDNPSNNACYKCQSEQLVKASSDTPPCIDKSSDDSPNILTNTRLFKSLQGHTWISNFKRLKDRLFSTISDEINANEKHVIDNVANFQKQFKDDCSIYNADYPTPTEPTHEYPYDTNGLHHLHPNKHILNHQATSPASFPYSSSRVSKGNQKEYTTKSVNQLQTTKHVSFKKSIKESSITYPSVVNDKPSNKSDTCICVKNKHSRRLCDQQTASSHQKHQGLKNVPNEKEIATKRHLPNDKASSIKEYPHSKKEKDYLNTKKDPLTKEFISSKKDPIRKDSLPSKKDSVTRHFVPSKKHSIANESLLSTKHSITKESLPSKKDSIIKESLPSNKDSTTKEYQLSKRKKCVLNKKDPKSELLPNRKEDYPPAHKEYPTKKEFPSNKSGPSIKQDNPTIKIHLPNEKNTKTNEQLWHKEYPNNKKDTTTKENVKYPLTSKEDSLQKYSEKASHSDDISINENKDQKQEYQKEIRKGVLPDIDTISDPRYIEKEIPAIHIHIHLPSVRESDHDSRPIKKNVIEKNTPSRSESSTQTYPSHKPIKNEYSLGEKHSTSDGKDHSSKQYLPSEKAHLTKRESPRKEDISKEYKPTKDYCMTTKYKPIYKYITKAYLYSKKDPATREYFPQSHTKKYLPARKKTTGKEDLPNDKYSTEKYRRNGPLAKESLPKKKDSAPKEIFPSKEQSTDSYLLNQKSSIAVKNEQQKGHHHNDKDLKKEHIGTASPSDKDFFVKEDETTKLPILKTDREDNYLSKKGSKGKYIGVIKRLWSLFRHDRSTLPGNTLSKRESSPLKKDTTQRKEEPLFRATKESSISSKEDPSQRKEEQLSSATGESPASKQDPPQRNEEPHSSESNCHIGSPVKKYSHSYGNSNSAVENYAHVNKDHTKECPTAPSKNSSGKSDPQAVKSHNDQILEVPNSSSKSNLKEKDVEGDSERWLSEDRMWQMGGFIIAGLVIAPLWPGWGIFSD